MDEHEFKKFLRSRSWNDNQSKKFVDHAVDDPDLPDAKSWEELEAYLARGHEGAVEEAKYVWELYVGTGHA